MAADDWLHFIILPDERQLLISAASRRGANNYEAVAIL
jgi:hypothetical protein